MKFTRSLSAGLALLFTIAGCISPELRTARIAVNERDWDRALNAINAELARSGPAAEPMFLKGMIYEQQASMMGDSIPVLLSQYKTMSMYYDSSQALSNLFDDRINESRDRLFRKFLKRSASAADTANWDAALGNVDIAIIIAPNVRVLYQHAAVTAYNAEKFELAIKYANAEVEREVTDSTDLTVREVLVASYSRLKDNANMLKWGNDLLKRCDPVTDSATYLRTHDVLLSVFEETKNYDAAIAIINDAIKLYPGRITMLMNKALFMIKKEDYQGAGAIYREVIKLQPDNFEALLNLGTILVTDSKWQEAIPHLKRAHELEPTNTNALRNLMAAYYNTDQDKLGKEIRDKLDALSGGK